MIHIQCTYLWTVEYHKIPPRYISAEDYFEVIFFYLYPSDIQYTRVNSILPVVDRPKKGKSPDVPYPSSLNELIRGTDCEERSVKGRIRYRN
jgi:hypothetical protein